jgi:transcriptional regulator with XRE-family HTH domain
VSFRVTKEIRPTDQNRISKTLRAIRLAKKQTGLTKGYLSRIETSGHPPPIYTLAKISQALDIDIAELFSQRTSEKYTKLSIKRKKDHVIANQRGTSCGYIYEDLAPDKRGKNMEPFIVDVGFDVVVDVEREFRHDGEEFLYVLEGKMEFFYAGDTYILEAGDSAYFDSDTPHSGRSIGKRKARLLIISYSYRRA